MLHFLEAQRLCAQKNGMDAEQTTAVFELLMSATLATADGGALLLAMAERGETAVELAAWVTALRQKAMPLSLSRSCLDVCGTGGSGLSRFNVSTTVAFMCAAQGIPVAKHGNRGSQRANGSFDLLDALGIPFEMTADQMQQVFNKTNLCFLFARSVHPAVAQVVPYRKAAGRRSIFNLAGPLANPVEISHQVIGCINEETADVLAEALCILGREHACVVWGAPGIDEFSVTGPSEFYSVHNGQIDKHFSQCAMHPDLDHASLPGGDATENAEIFHDLLNGRERGPLRDMVLINAAAAIDLWNGHNNDMNINIGGDAYTTAEKCLDSGQALEAYESHKRLAKRTVAE